MSTPAAFAGRQRLSVAMIVRDEAALLPGALASVRGLADEIIVHDTGSRDATRDIARQHGAKVIEGQWHNDFAQARNVCLAQVTGDWVLWLDAGERVTDETAQALRHFLAANELLPRAFVMMVHVPGAVPGDLGEEVGRIRFHRHDRRLRFSGAIGETLRPALRAAEIAIEVSPWRITRTTAEHNLEVKRRKLLRNLPLWDRELRQQGPRPQLLVAKGEILDMIGERVKAADCFRQAIAHATRGSDELLAAYYGLLGTFDPKAPPTKEQVQLAVAALAVFPLDAQLLCAMGTYLQAQGHIALAQRSYRLAHEYGTINTEVWHAHEIAVVATICLSLTLQLEHRDDEALAVLDTARERYPRSQRLQRRALDLHVRHARVGDALELVDQLELAATEREALRSAVRGACHGAKQNWTFALSYLDTAYEAGCREVICLRWLTVSLLATGKLERGIPMLEAWSAMAPGDTEIAQLRAALATPATPTPVVESTPRPPMAAPPAPHTRTVPAPHISTHGPILPQARVDY